MHILSGLTIPLQTNPDTGVFLSRTGIYFYFIKLDMYDLIVYDNLAITTVFCKNSIIII